MSAEQRDKIVASDEFLSFFDRASRLVERALCSPADILFDYISGSGEDGRLLVYYLYKISCNKVCYI